METKVFLAEAVKPEPAVKPAGMPGPDEKAVFARIQKYAAENMPDGGNLGQLNNELMAAYGKSYIDDMGYGDFRGAVIFRSGYKDQQESRVFSGSAGDKRGCPR